VRSKFRKQNVSNKLLQRLKALEELIEWMHPFRFIIPSDQNKRNVACIVLPAYVLHGPDEAILPALHFLANAFPRQIYENKILSYYVQRKALECGKGRIPMDKVIMKKVLYAHPFMQQHFWRPFLLGRHFEEICLYFKSLMDKEEGWYNAYEMGDWLPEFWLAFSFQHADDLATYFLKQFARQNSYCHELPYFIIDQVWMHHADNNKEPSFQRFSQHLDSWMDSMLYDYFEDPLPQEPPLYVKKLVLLWERMGKFTLVDTTTMSHAWNSENDVSNESNVPIYYCRDENHLHFIMHHYS
jgi:hypothetical protein